MRRSSTSRPTASTISGEPTTIYLAAFAALRYEGHSHGFACRLSQLAACLSLTFGTVASAQHTETFGTPSVGGPVGFCDGFVAGSSVGTRSGVHYIAFSFAIYLP